MALEHRAAFLNPTSRTKMQLLFSMFLFLIFIPGRGASEARPADARDLARAVDARYNDLKSLKSSFVEVYQSPGVSRTESGTLWLKKPGRMRWEYRVPQEKLFLTDSENAYFYVPGERQA